MFNQLSAPGTLTFMMQLYYIINFFLFVGSPDPQIFGELHHVAPLKEVKISTGPNQQSKIIHHKHITGTHAH